MSSIKNELGNKNQGLAISRIELKVSNPESIAPKKREKSKSSIGFGQLGNQEKWPTWRQQPTPLEECTGRKEALVAPDACQGPVCAMAASTSGRGSRPRALPHIRA